MLSIKAKRYNEIEATLDFDFLNLKREKFLFGRLLEMQKQRMLNVRYPKRILSFTEQM